MRGRLSIKPTFWPHGSLRITENHSESPEITVLGLLRLLLPSVSDSAAFAKRNKSSRAISKCMARDGKSRDETS